MISVRHSNSPHSNNIATMCRAPLLPLFEVISVVEDNNTIDLTDRVELLYQHESVPHVSARFSRGISVAVL